MRYKKRDPVDYSKCDQYVTIYHMEDGVITRKAIRCAFFDFRKNEIVARTGQTESTGFLLVIPATVNNLSEQPVYNGDKVLMGYLGSLSGVYTSDGKQYITRHGKAYMVYGDDPIDSREAWANLIPSIVPGLAVVKYVDPKYWKGEIAHWEAGG